MDGMFPFGRGDVKSGVVPFGLDTPPWLGPTRSRAIPITRRDGEACRCVHIAPPPPWPPSRSAPSRPPPSRSTPGVIPSATAELHPARLPCSTSTLAPPPLLWARRERGIPLLRVTRRATDPGHGCTLKHGRSLRGPGGRACPLPCAGGGAEGGGARQEAPAARQRETGEGRRGKPEREIPMFR
jgi:hypothetical protein